MTPGAASVFDQAMRLYWNNLRFVAEAGKITFPSLPEWATENRAVLDLKTMLLRDFSVKDPGPSTPVLVVAPYAGHSSIIADYDKGQSLVETLQAGGLGRLLVTDWKSATQAMKDFERALGRFVPRRLAECNVRGTFPCKSEKYRPGGFAA